MSDSQKKLSSRLKHNMHSKMGRKKINDQIYKLKELLPECKHVECNKATILLSAVKTLERLQKVEKELTNEYNELLAENTRLNHSIQALNECRDLFEKRPLELSAEIKPESNSQEDSLGLCHTPSEIQSTGRMPGHSLSGMPNSPIQLSPPPMNTRIPPYQRMNLGLLPENITPDTEPRRGYYDRVYLPHYNPYPDMQTMDQQYRRMAPPTQDMSMSSPMVSQFPGHYPNQNQDFCYPPTISDQHIPDVPLCEDPNWYLNHYELNNDQW